MSVHRIDKGLITFGLILILTGVWIFTRSKNEREVSGEIVAQLKFLKNTVRTKSAGGFSWFTGVEEEKIGAFGLGLTGKNSSAKYLYVDKYQVLSLDESLIEFLPENTVKLKSGKVVFTNPDPSLKLIDSDGNIITPLPNMLYSPGEGMKGKQLTRIKRWTLTGSDYSIDVEGNNLFETYLLKTPIVSFTQGNDGCLGIIKPISGDEGDVNYEILNKDFIIPRRGMTFKIPDERSSISIAAFADSLKSNPRILKIPEYCISTEPVIIPEPVVPAPAPVIPIPAPAPAPPAVIAKPVPPAPEIIEFFSKPEIYEVKSRSEIKEIEVFFRINSPGILMILGPGLKRSINVKSKYNENLKLSPGTYSFSLEWKNKKVTKSIDIKIKKPNVRNAIFIEE